MGNSSAKNKRISTDSDKYITPSTSPTYAEDLKKSHTLDLSKSNGFLRRNNKNAKKKKNRPKSLLLSISSSNVKRQLSSDVGTGASDNRDHGKINKSATLPAKQPSKPKRPKSLFLFPAAIVRSGIFKSSSTKNGCVLRDQGDSVIVPPDSPTYRAGSEASSSPSTPSSSGSGFVFVVDNGVYRDLPWKADQNKTLYEDKSLLEAAQNRNNDCELSSVALGKENRNLNSRPQETNLDKLDCEDPMANSKLPNDAQCEKMGNSKIENSSFEDCLRGNKGEALTNPSSLNNGRLTPTVSVSTSSNSRDDSTSHNVKPTVAQTLEEDSSLATKKIAHLKDNENISNKDAIHRINDGIKGSKSNVNESTCQQNANSHKPFSTKSRSEESKSLENGSYTKISSDGVDMPSCDVSSLYKSQDDAENHVLNCGSSKSNEKGCTLKSSNEQVKNIVISKKHNFNRKPIETKPLSGYTEDSSSTSVTSTTTHVISEKDIVETANMGTLDKVVPKLVESGKEKFITNLKVKSNISSKSENTKKAANSADANAFSESIGSKHVTVERKDNAAGDILASTETNAKLKCNSSEGEVHELQSQCPLVEIVSPWATLGKGASVDNSSSTSKKINHSLSNNLVVDRIQKCNLGNSLVSSQLSGIPTQNNNKLQGKNKLSKSATTANVSCVRSFPLSYVNESDNLTTNTTNSRSPKATQKFVSRVPVPVPIASSDDCLLGHRVKNIDNSE